MSDNKNKPEEEKPLQPVTLVFTPDEIIALSTVLETALRGGGMQVLDSVYLLRNKVASALNEQ